MLKTQEELTKSKNECESSNSKLNELSDDELGYVTGGSVLDRFQKCPHFGTTECKYNDYTKSNCPHYNEYVCAILVKGF